MIIIMIINVIITVVMSITIITIHDIYIYIYICYNTFIILPMDLGVQALEIKNLLDKALELQIL